jgi:hypothetical protein
MRSLVAPDSPEEREEIVKVLLANGIRCRETPPTLFGRAKLWVDEADYEKAREIAASVDAKLAAQSRERWGREWQERYGGSYARWLLERIQSPEILLKIVLLIAALAAFVGYPIYVVFSQ